MPELTAQALDDLESLEAAGQLPPEMKVTMGDMRLLRDAGQLGAVSPQSTPGAPAPTVQPTSAAPPAPAPAAPGAMAGAAVGGALAPDPMAPAPGPDPLASTAAPDAPAPPLPQVPEPGIVPPPPVHSAPMQAFGALVRRGVARPASELNALAFKWKVPGALSPREFKGRLVRAGRLPGAEQLREDVPEGFLETISALASPTAMLNAPLFAVGTGISAATGSDKVADLVEGVLGLGGLVRGGLRVWRNVRGYSPNELTHLEAIADAERAGDDVAAATAARGASEAARDAIRADVERATHSAIEQSAMAKAAAGGRLSATRADADAVLDAADRGEAALPSAEAAVRDALGLFPGAPTAEEAGRMLRATGAEAESLIPGTRVGAAAMRSSVLREATRRYEAGRVIADKSGAVLEPLGAGHTALLDGARQTMSRVGTTLGKPERALVQRLRWLGAKGLRNPATGEIMEAPLPKLQEMRRANPSWQIEYGPIPYRALNELYAEAANRSVDPRTFGASTSRDSREFYRLIRGQLKSTMEAVEQTNPALRTAAMDADRFYRNQVVPIGKAARKALSPSATERAAFGSTIGNTRDPTHLRTLVSMSGSDAERATYTTAAFDALVRGHTDSLGRVDMKGVLRQWNQADPEWRKIVSSGSNAAAEKALNEWTAQIGAGKELASFTRKQRIVLERAEKDVGEAIKSLAGAQKRALRGAREVDVSGRRARGSSPAVHGESTTGIKGRVPEALTDVAIGAGALATGSWFWAATEAGRAIRTLVSHPRLVRDAIRMSKEDPNYRAIAGALGSVLRGPQSIQSGNGQPAP